MQSPKGYGKDKDKHLKGRGKSKDITSDARVASALRKGVCVGELAPGKSSCYNCFCWKCGQCKPGRKHTMEAKSCKELKALIILFKNYKEGPNVAYRLRFKWNQ